MSYNPQTTPRTNEPEKAPRQGDPSQGDQKQPERRPNQQNNPQGSNVQGFPQQKTKAGDGPANNPDDSPQPQKNEPTKANRA